MSELKTTIVDTLESSLLVIPLVTAVYYGMADPQAKFAYILLQKIPGAPASYTFGEDEQPVTIEEIYQVKACSIDTAEQSGQLQSEQIMAAVKATLPGLTVDNPEEANVLSFRFDNDLPDYQQPRPQGPTVFMVGATFRAILNPL